MREEFKNWKRPVIKNGELTRWNWIVYHSEKLDLGDYTDIGAFTYINAKHGIKIGDHVQIGSHCSLYTVSTIDEKIGPIVIGENAKIGSHSLIMPGITIGANATIGAYSFVNKDVPPNSVAWGIPVEIKKNHED